MYTIFINESVIYLRNEAFSESDIPSFFYKENDFGALVGKLLAEPIKEICYYHFNLDKLWKDFKSHFKIIEAAGGLVFNEKGETLWIYRHNKWDLPKGKIDKGESIEEAAVREVQEECGLKNIRLDKFLVNTYHIYKYKEKTVLKISHWFRMFANSDEELIPQLDEHITEVAWKSNVKLSEILNNTYGNIKLICNFANHKEI